MSRANTRCAATSAGADVIRPHGGYRQLRSYQVSAIIYDGTVEFCDLHIDRRSRTHDQMVQAARSGKQNIAEGSAASATSQTTELRLTSVAKASLEELLLDYEDFLRQRRLRLWDKGAPEARRVRGMSYSSEQSYWSDVSDQSDLSDYRACIRRSPEVAANTLICLIHQCTYLLRRQLLALEQRLLDSGGFRERLYHARRARR